MKKIRTLLIFVLLSIFVIGVISLIITFATVSIKFAILFISFLSLTVTNSMQIIVEMTIVSLLVALIIMILYYSFLHKLLPISSKKGLEPAPTHIQRVFADYKFSNNKISELHNRATLLLDKFDNSCNAYAYKSNSIVITNGFNCSKQHDEEKKAVLFHEFAHLVNKDNQIKYSIFCFNRLIILLPILNATFFYTISICAMLYLAPYADIVFLYKVSFFNGMIELIIFTLCHLLDEIIEMFYLYKSRQSEYSADKFAADAGMKTHLISFLKSTSEYKLEKRKKRRCDFFDSHPSIIKRIAKLEKL